jgi:mono/diheme cytochrome c family protein
MYAARMPRPDRASPPSLLTAAALLLAALSACAGSQLPADKITSPGEALFNGRIRPDVNCYQCHNGDATGTMRGPNLGKRVPKLTDQQIAQAIAEGPGFMPSFKDKVSAAEVQQITAWLRKQFPQ